MSDLVTTILTTINYPNCFSNIQHEILVLLRQRWIHHFKIDWINKINHMYISGIEPSSVIICQTNYSRLEREKIKSIYHADEASIGKTWGVNSLVLTEPWWGPDERFILRVSQSLSHFILSISVLDIYPTVIGWFCSFLPRRKMSLDRTWYVILY